MTLPQPLVDLKDHCSIIHNNTLYTFQPDAFQSLDLRPGGRWSRLPMGVSTKGSVCVRGSPNGEDSLFVVGGTTNSSTHDYTGLQRYSFKNKTWDKCKPSDSSAINRLGHSSAYLNASSSILIFGGSQDGVAFPSSQTFSISTLPPYTIIAYSSDAPPLIKPLLLSLNTSHALMLGGNPQNRDLYTFAPKEGWRKVDFQLDEGLKDSSKVQSVLVNGSDGRNFLEFFDMDASPNNITLQPLQKPVAANSSDSDPSSPSTSSPEQPSKKKRKRSTAGTDRLPYNNTLAPHERRSGFSLAQDPGGLVVASGGQSDAGGYVLAMFNQTGNQWIDPARFFEVDTETNNLGSTPKASPSAASSSTAALPSITSTSMSTSSDETNSKSHPLTILGATLGAVFGLAALLIIILLLLRCTRRRRAKNRNREAGNYPLGDEREMDFADQGVDFMREAGGSFATKSNHQHVDSGHTLNSLAIMSGSARAGTPQSKRGFLHKPGDSSGSAKSFFSRAKSPLASSPPLISGPIRSGNPGDVGNGISASPEPRTEPRTDTGWSRYFANNSATNIVAGAPGNTHNDSASRPTTYTSNSQSDYGSSRIASSNPHESAEIQPLSIRANDSHPPNSQVVSPTSGLPIPGLALSSESPNADPPSPATLVSDIDDVNEFHHDDEARQGSEGMASWTPIAASERGSTWTDRPISSIYADSLIYPHPGERVRIPNFPRVPSTARNSTARNSQVEPLADSRGMRSVASREFRTPQAEAHDRALPEVGSRRVAPPVFAAAPDERWYSRRPEDGAPRERGGPETEDMSWLNLGR